MAMVLMGSKEFREGVAKDLKYLFKKAIIAAIAEDDKKKKSHIEKPNKINGEL